MVHRADAFVTIAWLLVASVTFVEANERDLARARQAYNAGNQDTAIEAAQVARGDPKTADAGAIVLARAHLERFRVAGRRQDLDTAREVIRSIQSARLTPRDRIELTIGLGEALYLDGAYGAAAEIFEPLLDDASPLGSRAHERVVDWWAGALDAEARTHPVPERYGYYQRIVTEMDAQLAKDNGPSVASYWLAAGALGMGDVARAWQAAVAGWVRAGLSPEAGIATRTDLDRLVTQAIIPDRVRSLALPAREVAAATAGIRNEWELFKQRWR